MKRITNGHTVFEIALNGLTLEASHWPDDNGGPIHTALVVRTGAARIQVSVTLEELYKLAELFLMANGSLADAQKTRDSLASADA